MYFNSLTITKSLLELLNIKYAVQFTFTHIHWTSTHHIGQASNSCLKNIMFINNV